MKLVMYVVVAYRWGKRDDHSYTVGVFSKKLQAMKCAAEHAEYRGGKYACVVESCVMNEFDNEADEYTKEVYRTKSSM